MQISDKLKKLDPIPLLVRAAKDYVSDGGGFIQRKVLASALIQTCVYSLEDSRKLICL